VPTIYLLADEAIDEGLVAKLRSWQHNGFSVDNQVRIEASACDGRQHWMSPQGRSEAFAPRTEMSVLGGNSVVSGA
jgi:hypothetical protein